MELTLPKNLAAIKRRDAEIILVDWHSDDGLAEWIKSNFKREISRGLLTFYRLQDDLPFGQPIGKNFAHRFATKEIVINLDADNFIGDLWRGAQSLEANEILVCEEFGRGSCGRIGLPRKALEKTNGYDEAFEPAGHHDLDLIKRAVKLGFKKCHWPCNIPPIKNTKAQTLLFSGGGGHAEWQTMEKRNAARSARNISAGLFKANQKGFIRAGFERNFRDTLVPDRQRYFIYE
jgi:hypothetical protein